MLQHLNSARQPSFGSLTDRLVRGLRKAPRLLLVWIALTAVLGEIGVRLLIHLPLDYIDEKTSCYRYDELLGWFPRESADCVHEAQYSTAIRHNSRGFRDPEPLADDQRPTIAVLGDSFVWGYDVERHQRLTHQLQRFLPGHNVLNLGVSGYGTDQELLLLQRWFDRLRPELVILVAHTNDAIDNSTNYRDHYYKPYFVLERDELLLRGTPVPTAYRYQQQQNPVLFRSHFVRGLAVLYNRWTKARPLIVPNLQTELILEMHRFLSLRGAALRVLYTYERDPADPELAQLATAGVPTLHAPTDHRFPAYGRHWTPAGHSMVANRLLEDLYRSGVIDDDDLDKYPDD